MRVRKFIGYDENNEPRYEEEDILINPDKVIYFNITNKTLYMVEDYACTLLDDDDVEYFSNYFDHVKGMIYQIDGNKEDMEEFKNYLSKKSNMITNIPIKIFNKWGRKVK